ncbi:MAG TPA: methyltransferase domain-containing protein [Gaiellaceae bacterium]|jgi:SAM-dependent methyltransferase|nr:methyltransferase domain-containing protein [Gaiellaceae bacterium]
MWDPARTAEYFDEYGEQEWTRFETGRTPGLSLTTHIRTLEGYVRPGDRALDAGAGPGRFTLELLRLVAHVTALDISPGQLELLRARVPDVEAMLGDITDLSRFEDDTFDVTVCFGGPLSYVLDRADRAVAELVRVTRPGGHVLVSVMGFAGAVIHYASILVDLARRDGPARSLEVARTGVLPEGEGYGHLTIRMYLWDELEDLLSPHGEVVGGAAAGVLPHLEIDEPEIHTMLEEFEERLAYDPGSRSCGEHLIGVLRVG